MFVRETRGVCVCVREKRGGGSMFVQQRRRGVRDREEGGRGGRGLCK